MYLDDSDRILRPGLEDVDEEALVVVINQDAVPRGEAAVPPQRGL